MPDVFRCPLDWKQRDKNCSSYMMVTGLGAEQKHNNKYVLIIETNNTTHNWLEPVDFPIDNFDLEPDRSGNRSQLRRACKHYNKYGFTTVYCTMTNFGNHSWISEDTKPEALKAAADPERRKQVEVTYPWGEAFGIQRLVLRPSPAESENQNASKSSRTPSPRP